MAGTCAHMELSVCVPQGGMIGDYKHQDKNSTKQSCAVEFNHLT